MSVEYYALLGLAIIVTPVVIFFVLVNLSYLLDSRFIGLKKGRFTGNNSWLRSPVWFRSLIWRTLRMELYTRGTAVAGNRHGLRAGLGFWERRSMVSMLASWAVSTHKGNAAAAVKYRALTYDDRNIYVRITDTKDLIDKPEEKRLFESFLEAEASPEYAEKFADFFHTMQSPHVWREDGMQVLSIPSPSEVRMLQHLPFENTISLFVESVKR